jgi:hypothetical protein
MLQCILLYIDCESVSVQESLRGLTACNSFIGGEGADRINGKVEDATLERHDYVAR